MQATSIHCPYCSTKLRIRERMFVGMQVGCPECGQPLCIRAEGSKGFAVDKGDGAAEPSRGKPLMAAATAVLHRFRPPAAAPKEPPAAPASSTTVPPTAEAAAEEKPPLGISNPLPRWCRWIQSPAGVSWLVAGTIAVVMLLLTAAPDREVSTRLPSSQPKGSAKGRPAATAVAEKNTTAAPPVGNEATPLESNLAALGQSLNRSVKDRGHFPSGTKYAEGLSPEQRFSWLADLRAREDDSVMPFWDRPWDDPLNDRFVRRSIPAFLNPSLDASTGAGGYPAAHFAGMAGVGADAPTLSVDHPRAGVFGHNRATRMDDIRDGAANTLAVVGVSDRLGAWAAGGAATIRSLTAEPYVNGPDGLGTGQADGMHVLMADGSVRFFDRETDPVIWRRMAAMADGLPLDPSVPGEPGDRPQLVDADMPNPVAVPSAQPAAVPAAVAEVPEPSPQQPRRELAPAEKIDVAAQLSQPILRFEQVKPARVRELLAQIEEMAAVPIRFDAEQLADKLDAPVSVKVQETTVGELLSEILQSAGLAFRAADGEIVIEAEQRDGSSK